MTSAQPPSNGDRPATGQEAAPQEAAVPTPAPAPKRTTTRRSPAASKPAANQPAATTPPASKPAARKPAAKKPEDAENPVKRTPSARKRSTTASQMSPNGEAPEILDAMLGKPPAVPAPDTSASPAEPVVTEAVTPEPSETETAVLPSAEDFYREPTTETEVLTPVEAAVIEQQPDESPLPSNEAPSEPATEEAQVSQADAAAPHAAAQQTGAAAPEGAPESGRPGRSMNDLAERLDDSRFFSSLFDFTFTSYVTRKLAGPVYVVGLVLIGLGIVVGFANSLGIAIAAHSPGGAFVFLLGVLVTLVGAILAVLLLRVTIEVFCAIIEIAQNTRRRRPPRD